MTPHVRQARDRDTPGIAALLQRIIADHDKEPPPVDRLLRPVEHILRAPGAWFFVAEIAGRLVGMAQVNERYSTWDGGHYGYIEDFFVVEDRRGQGIGAAMLAHIEADARSRGWVRIDLDVLAGNEATRLYRRVGFEESGYAIYRRVLR